MNHEEAHALRRIAAILGTVSTPAERRTIALRIENRISGGDSDPLAFALRHAAALFHPGDAAKTQAIRQRINAAFAAEELVTAIPKGHHHITLSDLAAWPGRPPMAADSPLRYWMPDAPAPQAAPPEPQHHPKTPPEWIELARKRAREIIDGQAEKDLFPSLVDVADEIARAFRADGVHGAAGKPLTGAYIKRRALQGTGISSAKGRQLSTAPRRGK